MEQERKLAVLMIIYIILGILCEMIKLMAKAKLTLNPYGIFL